MKLVGKVAMVIFFLWAGDGFAVTPTLTITAPKGLYVNKTNQAALSLNGQCKVNSDQISISVSGRQDPPITAVCNSNLNWSVTNVNTFGWPDGKYDFTASETGSNAKLNVVKDTQAPFLSLVYPQNGFVILEQNQSAISISGICTPLGGKPITTIEVTISNTIGQKKVLNLSCDTSLDPITLFPKNSYSTLAPSPVDLSSFIDGTIFVSVKATTESGNYSEASASYLKDTAPVLATITAAPTAVNISNQASLQVSGTCSFSGGPVTLAIYNADNTLATKLVNTCDSNHQWQATNLSLSNVKDVNLTFRALHQNITTRLISNPLATDANRVVVKDTVAPQIAFAADLKKYKMNTSATAVLSVNGKCTKGDLSVNVGTIDSLKKFQKIKTVPCTATGTFKAANLDFTSFADGVITLSIRQSDQAGNQGRQDLSFTKKLSLPSVTIGSNAIPPEAGKPGKYINSTLQTVVLLSGTCSEFGSNGQQVKVTAQPALPAQPLNAVCNAGNWTLKITISDLAEGPVVFSASTSDFVGNVSEIKSLNLIKDTTPPVLTLTQPLSNFVINKLNYKQTVNFKGTCSDALKLSGAVTANIACQSSQWSYNLDASTMADGNLLFNFSATDIAGNTSIQPLTLKKDIVTEVISIAPPGLYIMPSDKTNTLSWLSAPNALSYEVYRSSVSGSGYAKVATVAKALEYKDRNLTNGSLYYYVVRSFGVNNVISENSTEVAGRPGKYEQSKLAAGSSHTCGLTSSGQAKCWGYNTWGQLGYTLNPTVPEPITTLDKGVTSMDVGDSHTCAVKKGEVYCWGDLGDIETVTPIKVILPAGIRATSVSSSSLNLGGGCALSDASDVYCWIDYKAPYKVSLPNDEKAKSISVGYNTSCAVLMSGKLACNDAGVLGNSNNSPVLRKDFSDVKSVSVGNYYYPCAVHTDGSVYCDGQPHYYPSNTSKISSGYNKSCAIDLDGKVFCGNSFNLSGPSPVPLFGDDGVTPVKVIDITVGNEDACAVLETGIVKCWGSNPSGLGDSKLNPTLESSTPVKVYGITQAVSVSAALSRPDPCILSQDGSVKCWGKISDKWSTPINILGF